MGLLAFDNFRASAFIHPSVTAGVIPLDLYAGTIKPAVIDGRLQDRIFEFRDRTDDDKRAGENCLS
jgi:hypothetical protein